MCFVVVVLEIVNNTGIWLFFENRQKAIKMNENEKWKFNILLLSFFEIENGHHIIKVVVFLSVVVIVVLISVVIAPSNWCFVHHGGTRTSVVAIFGMFWN